MKNTNNALIAPRKMRKKPKVWFNTMAFSSEQKIQLEMWKAWYYKARCDHMISLSLSLTLVMWDERKIHTRKDNLSVEETNLRHASIRRKLIKVYGIGCRCFSFRSMHIRTLLIPTHTIIPFVGSIFLDTPFLTLLLAGYSIPLGILLKYDQSW